MDARIEKTKNKIYEAYLAEKNDKRKEHIHVVDICKRAGINKTTFYNHYQNVFALADEVETKIVREMIADCKRFAQFWEDPRRALTELLQISMVFEPKIVRVFDDGISVFSRKLSKALTERYRDAFRNEKDRGLLAICLTGACILLENKFTEKNVVFTINLICDIIQKTR